jgi:hypothetical protein
MTERLMVSRLCMHTTFAQVDIVSHESSDSTPKILLLDEVDCLVNPWVSRQMVVMVLLEDLKLQVVPVRYINAQVSEQQTIVGQPIGFVGVGDRLCLESGDDQSSELVELSHLLKLENE